MFERISCLTVRCDRCQFVAEIDDTIAHFPEARQAVTHLSTLGWEFESSDRAVCFQCACVQACATHGHCWEPWRPCGCRGDLSRHRVLTLTAAAVVAGTCACQTRWCCRCDATEVRAAAVTGGAP
jgi:hypothetical protein